MENLNNLVRQYNGIQYDLNISKFDNIFDYLHFQVDKNGNNIFITELDNMGTTTSLKYKDFNLKFLKLTEYLISLLHMKKGDKVAILPKNNINSVLTILAVLRTGATAVILNSNEPENRLKEQLFTAECSYLLHDNNLKFIPPIEAFTIQSLVEHSDSLKSYNFKKIPLKNDYKYDPAIVMFTTGTTSSSKGVMQSNYNITINCLGLIQHHRLNSNKILLCNLPLYYANGLEFTIFSTMMAGAHVILPNDFNPFLMPKLVNKFKVNIVSLVPSMLNIILDVHKNYLDFASLDYFVTAAAPLSQQTSQLTYELINKRIIQGYGLTETTNFSTTIPIDLSEEDYIKWMINSKIPTVGSELFGNNVSILDSHGLPLPIGSEGEIVMRGHNIMLGYLNNPIESNLAFNHGWFNSGDLGYLEYDVNSQKKMLIITGRKKNIVKVGGQGVSLDEIDRVLSEIPEVRDVASVGLTNQLLGETIGVLVSAKNEITPDYIKKYLSQKIAMSKLILNIIFVEEIPRSMNGKLNRKLLIKYFK